MSTINMLGDSITNQWFTIYDNTLFNSKCGVTTLVNYGINGSTLTDGANSSNPMVTRYTSMSAADCIMLWGGTNDFTQLISISRFETALTTLIAGLKSQYPNKKIFAITPIPRTDENSSTPNLILYRNSIISICNGQSNVYVFDAYKWAGFNLDNISTYTYDGLHPIQIGYNQLSYAIGLFIRNKNKS